MRVGLVLPGPQPHAPMRQLLGKSPDEVQHGALSTFPPVDVHFASGVAGAADAADVAEATGGDPAGVDAIGAGSVDTGAAVLGDGPAAHATTPAPARDAAAQSSLRAARRSLIAPWTYMSKSSD